MCWNGIFLQQLCAAISTLGPNKYSNPTVLWPLHLDSFGSMKKAVTRAVLLNAPKAEEDRNVARKEDICFRSVVTPTKESMKGKKDF